VQCAAARSGGHISRIARDHSFKIGFADADAAGDPQAASLVKKLEAAMRNSENR